MDWDEKGWKEAEDRDADGTVDSADITSSRFNSVLTDDGNDECPSLSLPGDPSASAKDGEGILANGSRGGLRFQKALLLDAASEIAVASALKCWHQRRIKDCAAMLTLVQRACHPDNQRFPESLDRPLWPIVKF